MAKIGGDADTDRLTGSAGADLFLLDTFYSITDSQFDKTNKKKDGDVAILRR
jgi:hypothetical protein